VSSVPESPPFLLLARTRCEESLHLSRLDDLVLLSSKKQDRKVDGKGGDGAGGSPDLVKKKREERLQIGHQSRYEVGLQWDSKCEHQDSKVG
jgi:hypothetical protein